jgi:serine/threonine-protein kinase
VYSLGVILFDMLCGRPPFEAPQSSEVLAMHIHSQPPSPREFAPQREITEQAEAVILRAMQKDPERRYPDMKAFRRDLEGAYGSITYRRKGAPGRGLEPRGQEARTAEARSSKKRLTEEIDDWITNDPTGLSPEQARVVALVDTADKAFTPTTMSPQEAERLANALDRALDDED